LLRFSPTVIGDVTPAGEGQWDASLNSASARSWARSSVARDSGTASVENGAGSILSRSGAIRPKCRDLFRHSDECLRYSTVLVRAPKTFQDRTLWPEFLALSEELHAHLEELTDRIIREAINEDVSEAAGAGPRGVLPESSAASSAQGPYAASPGDSSSMERSPTWNSG
jgi:hypothetical protein